MTTASDHHCLANCGQIAVGRPVQPALIGSSPDAVGDISCCGPTRPLACTCHRAFAWRAPLHYFRKSADAGLNSSTFIAARTYLYSVSVLVGALAAPIGRNRAAPIN